MNALRLLVTEPLDGAANMALDDALLQVRLTRATPPTLRFFAWAPPTLSLGYGQPLDARLDLGAAEELGIGLVRRPTGGSAILHEGPDLEITYSVVAGAGDFPGADDLLATYRWIGGALEKGLQRLGVPAGMVPVQPSDPATMPAFCFARTGSYEIEVDGKKLVGSAQRRQGNAFLQHGSIMLGAAPSRLRRVFPTESDPLRGMTTLEAVLGRRPTFDDAVAAIVEGFAEVCGVAPKPGGLDADEDEAMRALTHDKYASDEWTQTGRLPRAVRTAS